MREYNFNELNSKDLMSNEVLVDEFISYLCQTLDYTIDEAKSAAIDMKNPYKVSYVMEEYEGTCNVGGEDFEIRYCYTDFTSCGFFHLADISPFEFFMLIKIKDLPDRTVNSYSQAAKYYLL